MDPVPWTDKGLCFSCTRCGRCCTNHGDHAYVYLSEEDEERLAAHLGLDREAFRARFCAEEDGWTVLSTERPECPFLGADRSCTVYGARPLQCRTWPFWRENLTPEAWEGPVKAICPGAGEGELHGWPEILRRARETEEGA